MAKDFVMMDVDDTDLIESVAQNFRFEIDFQPEHYYDGKS